MSKRGKRTGREPKNLPTVKAKPSHKNQDRSKYMPGGQNGEDKPAG